MENFRTIVLVMMLCFGITNLFGQKLPVIDSLKYNHIDNVTVETGTAEVVVEGKCISSWWGDSFLGSNGAVFTSYIIKVLKVFKGDIKDSIIEIISDGGIVPSGPNKGDIHESIWGGVGYEDEGLFFLRFNNTGINSGRSYKSCVFIGNNSWLRYQHKSAHFPITHVDNYMINDLDKDLYPLIIASTHIPPKLFGLNMFEREAQYEKEHPITDTIIMVGNRRVIVPKKDIGKFLDTLKKQSGK